MKRISAEIKELGILLRSVPSMLFALFVLSVVLMNLLANKSITFSVEWLAIDCGMLISWFSFLTLDIATKHFGPKAATELSLVAILINLFCCGVFFVVSVIEGVWSESFVEGYEGVINTALDNTFGGCWYVLLGSTVAFAVSSVVNNFSNFAIGSLFRRSPDGLLAYVARTYVSTALGQFVDNLTFAFIVSHFFFGWTLVQCLSCAFVGMIAELLFEVVFSFLGFGITKSWKKKGVGKEYFDYLATKKEHKI